MSSAAAAFAVVGSLSMTLLLGCAGDSGTAGRAISTLPARSGPLADVAPIAGTAPFGPSMVADWATWSWP